MSTTSTSNAVSFIMKHFNPFLHLDQKEVMKVGAEFHLPRFDESTMVDLLHTAIEDFKKNTSIVKVVGPVIVIGDLHGNIHDFLRIINDVPDSLSKTFVFLGDYVDRGNFQTELATLLISLAVQYPLNFILLRGNHEFMEINQKGRNCFYNEVTSIYSEKVYTLFNEVFSYLPLAAIVNDNILCLHGGIGPSFKKLDQLKEIELPYSSYENDKFVQDIVWSDPAYDSHGFDTSPRGVGHLFGMFVLNNFLKENNLKYLVRGHESIESGIQCDEARKVFTVFSSSGYKNNRGSGGYLTIGNDGKPTAFIFSFIQRILREESQFYEPHMRQGGIKSVHSFRSLSGIFVPNSRGYRRNGRHSHAEIDKVYTVSSCDHFYSCNRLPAFLT